MKSILLCLILCFVSLLTAPSSYADLHPSGGPAGPTNNSAALLAFGDTAFIGSNGYALRTTDGGKTWVQLTNGLGKFPYRIQPRCYGRSGDKIYMGCQGAVSVYVSSDMGDHWTSFVANIPANGITTNAASSNGRVFMAGNGFIPLSYTSANDTGWTATSVGGIVSAISVIGKDSVWATLGGKTFYSHDNGNTWTQIAKEPLTGGGLGATDFVKAGNRIIALTNGGGNTVNYYSDDYGTTWKQASKPFGAGHTFVKVSDNEIYADGYYTIPPDLSTVICAVYKSTDRGDTWIAQGKMPNAFAIARWRSDDFIITGGGGLYTQHRDDTVASLNPLPFTIPKSLVDNGSNLFTFTDRGLFKRPTSGGTWEFVSNLKSYYTSRVNNLEVNNGLLYLSTDSGTFKGNDGINFQEIGGPLKGKNIVSYFVSGNTHLAAQTSVTQFFSTFRYTTDTIHYSTDGGAHWQISPIQFTSTPTFQATGFMEHAGKFYLMGNTGQAVSSDKGATWTFTNTTSFAYTVGPRLYSFGNVLERERNAPGTGTFAVEQSLDGGTTWTVDTVGLPVNVIKWPETNGIFLAGDKLYAYCTSPGSEGIFVKSTPTASWTRLPNIGALPNYPTAMVASGSDLFFAVYGEGVWTTQAQVVTPIEGGLELLSGGSLDLGSHPAGSTSSAMISVRDSASFDLTNITVAITGPDASQFSVGTYSSSITAGASAAIAINFNPTGAAGPRTALATITYTAGAGEVQTAQVQLMGDVAAAGVEEKSAANQLMLTPNPAHQHVRILSQTEEALHVTIMNALGSTVYSTSTLDGNLDLPGLPAGVYIVRVEGPSTSLHTKLVIE